ncbi:MAG: hypothetical protein BGO12_10400 [Verrucomicrobia bacterium 61-8]|nr:ankyrin repeat domain-containing protein [Verrucomicrobiota bacterium]OJV26187.1 MAG: hypothetical protein BGO12_10400 [Verrucomicrobia bacterium 61-8]
MPSSQDGPQKRLPARPSLEFLRKEAKKLHRSLKEQNPDSSLSQTQHALARDYGFAAWAELITEVNRRLGADSSPASPDILASFLNAAVPRPEADHKAGPLAPAETILATHPDLAARSLAAASVLGDVETVRDFLQKSSPTQPESPHGWTPLVYLCFSRFLRDRARPETHFVECARLLLDHGASAREHFLSPQGEIESALYGAAGIANSAALTRLLLEAGADPNDGEALYHAAEFSTHGALQALLEAKPDSSWVSYCMCHKMDYEDPEGVALFLRHGADPSILLDRGVFAGSRPLHFAIYRRRGPQVLRLLLDAGADPSLADKDGLTPARLAARLGQKETLGVFGTETLDDESRYLLALSSGDRSTAETLQGAFPEAPQNFPHLLVDAAEAGNLEAVRLMLDLGFPIDTRGASYGGWNGTALDHAAWGGHVEIVRLLLERGADFRLVHSYNGTALGAAIHGASHAGHDRGAATIEVLARAYTPSELNGYISYSKTEPNPDIPPLLRRIQTELPQVGDAQLVAAAQAGDTAGLRRLLDAHPDRMTRAWGGPWDQPLLHLAATSGHADCVRLLLERGFDPDMRDHMDKATALHFAAGEGRLEVVKVLLDAGADIEGWGNDHELNVLGWATSLGPFREETARHLLSRGATMTIWSAIALDDADAVRRIVREDPDLLATARMSRNEDARSPLHHAVERNRPAMVRLLLELGAAVDRRDALGFSALGCVHEKTDPSILALLERSGLQLGLYDALVLGRYDDAERLLDPSAIRRGGAQTHLFVYAVAKGNWRMAEWLLAHGADINAIAEVYQCPATALHFAVENKPVERIRWLLDHGADPTIKDGRFDSDAHGWAAFLGRDEIVRIIDEHLARK